MSAGELAHVLFSLEVGCEATLAGKFNFMPVLEIDMAAPCPCIGIRIFLHYPDEGLVAVRILYSVPLPVLHIGFHTATLVVVERYSKRVYRRYLPFAILVHPSIFALAFSTSCFQTPSGRDCRNTRGEAPGSWPQLVPLSLASRRSLRT